MNDLTEILSVAGTIVLMIAVFVAAYFVSKYVAKHYKPNYSSSKNIHIIDNTPVGKDRSLLIVKAGGKVFLVGSTPNELTLLSELDAEQLSSMSDAQSPQSDFLTTFRSVLKGKLNKPDDGEK